MTKKQKKENLEKQSKIMLVIFTFLGITMLATIISTNFLAKGTYSAASCADFGLNECPEDEGCSIELVGSTMKCVGTYTGNQTPRPTATPKPTVTPNTTPTPTSGFNQTACADEADEECGTSNWSGCRTSYNYTCNSTFTNECNVSVSTVSKHVSVTSDGTEDENSYYVVNVSYTGNGCKNQTITYTATNAKALSTTSYRIVSSTDGTTQFSVYPADDCDASMATATLTNGNHDETDLVTTKTDWVSYSACEENPDYTSFEAADADGADHYYSNPSTCTANGVQKNAYTVKWVRYGCGGGNYDTSTPTPTPTSTPKPSSTPTPTPTSTPKPSSTPTPTSTPKPSSTPTPTSSSTPTPTLSPTPTSSVKKCYVCSKNNKSQYVWATSNSAAANSATQLTGVTANNCTITDNSNCTIIPTSNCYECNVNGTNKHIWTTSEELAKQQTGANSCKIVETKACNSITPPPTGTVALIIAWIIGMMTIGYAMWYFEKTNS